MTTLLTFIFKTGVIWVLSFVVLKIFYTKYKNKYDIDGFLERKHLTIQLFYIGLGTTKLNGIIKRISLRYEKFWYYWFKIGSWVSLILLPTSMGLLIYNLSIIFFKPVGVEPVISPIVPGVNVKGSDSWYLIISVIVSMVIHELGHAIASFVSKCEIHSVGFFFLFIMPGASVNLDISEMDKATLWEKLRIQCGGVWHNVVLCIIGYLLLTSSSFILSPIYRFPSDKLYITHIPQGSFLEKSLTVGDQILEINNCKVYNTTGFIQCIYGEIAKPKSYCLSPETISCIKEHPLRSCFGVNDVSTLIDCEEPTNFDMPLSDKCEKLNKQCVGFKHLGSFVFTLKVYSQDFLNSEDLTFISTPQELWDSIQVNNYQSRIGFINSWDIPWYWNHFFSYLIPVSAGLAAFNIISIPNMDGEHILDTLLSIILLQQVIKNSPNSKSKTSSSSSSSSSSQSSSILGKKERTKKIIFETTKYFTILIFGLTVIFSFYNLSNKILI
ncbi:hypothetical protein DICPUDRAFT_91002 [Dictyostelium purpureum]|uniref:Endopeptidase S2P n=1 Tax=Dictyostelium purpureum TaxID=5786 RepID=F1A6C9_DICPU|nr:uncharacterized protein DICPUDRAFT_91002 [Dictyostelium purpureum]EGC28250.1 hypothetical protein DICPUDRAFT_91002 [Dictyostelium purpureum]|eukprot:XP_003295223.1 hypothetical protein DICPUDRAFT_91002 [Dictyostelium purpureum]